MGKNRLARELNLNLLRGFITLIACLALIIQVACSGGGSGGNPPQVVAPSGLTYNTNPAIYTKGVAIAPNTPSSGGGTVVSYSISPALPAGLSLSPSAGSISGTPSSVSAIASYTVTATNSGGTASVILTLTVNDNVVAPSGLTYSTNPAIYVKDTAIAPNTPSSSGGAVVTYVVSPSLPAGLSLNTSTGIIMGMPTAVSALAGSTVTATNSAGSTSVILTITVNALPVPGPLKVVGRFLQDANGADVMMRGANVPVYKSGYADDLDAVAAAVATTQINVVRMEWWAVPPAGTTQYTPANLDRALQKYANLGILPIVSLWDLTFKFGHDDKVGPNSDGNSQALFAATITAYWTRADVLAILIKHQNHLVINIANEWGSSTYNDATSTATNFIQNYSAAITALRNAGIRAPLMVDAPKGFEYQFILDHGPAILALDPQANTMLSAHAYWAAVDYGDPAVVAIMDGILGSGLPIVLGEASSNAYTAIPCDPIHYATLLTRANANRIGYLFWAWYEDGQCGQLMNITVLQDGVTIPTAANPGFGYDALQGPGYGINVALPSTMKIVFH